MTYGPVFGPASFSTYNNVPGFTLAVEFAAGKLSAQGTATKITLKAGAAVGLAVAHAYMDGVQLTFGGQPGFSIAAGQSVTSDPFSPLDPSVLHRFKCYVPGPTNSDPCYVAQAPAISGCATYYTAGSDNSATNSTAGMTAYSAHWLVAEIDADGVSGGTGGGMPPVAGEPIALYAIWGQSHTVGSAPIQDQSAYRNRSRIKTFLNGAWGAAADPLSIGAGPFEQGLMGFGMPMADEMVLLLPDYIQGPIVRAHGSTSINQWAAGGALLNAAIADWQAAFAAAPAGSFWAGMGGWQGESDNPSPSGWGTKRLAIATAIRSALNAPDMPDVIVCCDSQFPAILSEQLALGLSVNTARVRIDDQPVPATVTDITDPAVFRVVGRRFAWATRGMLLR